MRTIGRLATRVALCLGFLVCLTVLGASAASAQACPGSGSGSGSGAGCTTTTVEVTVPGSATTTSGSGVLPLTGEQAAIPLAAAAGIIVLVLGARQLRRRTNN